MSVIIGGVESFTTVDFPGRLAAVLFCLGCPLRCPYCHNVALQDFKGKPFISWETFLEFLQDRKKLLDGVVFSGGEPLSQPDLFDGMKQIKDMGYEIGLHTSGVSKERLKQVIPLLDWVGFDVKVPFDDYEKRIPHSNGRVIEESLDMLLASGVDTEVRTTLDPRLISEDELLSLAKKLSDKGVKTYAIQEYRPHPDDENQPSAVDVFSFFRNQKLLSELKNLFPEFIIRRA